MGLKNEFETAMVDEPSVFEPLKFYCISISILFNSVLKFAILSVLNVRNVIIWH